MAKAVCFAFISFSPSREARRQRKGKNISSTFEEQSQSNKVLKHEDGSIGFSTVAPFIRSELWERQRHSKSIEFLMKNFSKHPRAANKKRLKHHHRIICASLVCGCDSRRKVFISNAISRCAIKTRGGAGISRLSLS
jgi:hypothetical protein